MFINIPYASIDYLEHDVKIMTELGLRPGKAEKDKVRSAILEETVIDNLVKDIDDIIINKDNVVQKPNETLTILTKCNKNVKKIISPDPLVYIYPANNVTMMKILKILPMILTPEIVAETKQSVVWTTYTTSGKRTFDIKNKTEGPPNDLLGDDHEFRYESSNFINNQAKRENIITAFNILTIYITGIIEDINKDIIKIKNGMQKDINPTDWVHKIGQMVYSYREDSVNDFINNPLVLVHLIKMLCEGLQYNLFRDVQKSVVGFINALNKLEIECYKYQISRA